MDVCGHTFTAQLPAEKCGACGQIAIQGHDMKLFELRVAIELAKAGPRAAESFKFRWHEDAPGTWLYHCHVEDHMMRGMIGIYQVSR